MGLGHQQRSSELHFDKIVALVTDFADEHNDMSSRWCGAKETLASTVHCGAPMLRRKSAASNTSAFHAFLRRSDVSANPRGV